MLSSHDDYPIHQTIEPIAHPSTGDRNFYDRYWFNGYSRDGEYYFGIALGVYPNRSVMDASLSLVRADGMQHSVHMSRRAPQDRSDTRVGPLRIHVLEPMRTLRVTVEPNETGIEADLTFRARTAAIEEPVTHGVREGRIFMHTSRFTQFGLWEGFVTAGGERIAISPETTVGTRDRSWGVRPVGEPEGGAPPTGGPQFFFAWSPCHFEDVCTHFGTFEYGDGAQWHAGGNVTPAYDPSKEFPAYDDPETVRFGDISHIIEWEKGTRRARRAELTLTPHAGEPLQVELEPILRFQMLGIGYGHPEWGHGRWKGEEAIGGESWNVNDLNPLDPRHLHIQQVCRANLGGRPGVGVLEQIVIGPYEPAGFKEILDGAR